MSLASSGRTTGHLSAGAALDCSPDAVDKRLAVACDDGVVRIFDMATMQPEEELAGHSGPVVRVAWAHHRFGSVLACSSSDGEVSVWADPQGKGEALQRVFTQRGAAGSYGLAWGPAEFGPMFAASIADGTVTIYSCNTGDLTRWEVRSFGAHRGGCHGVSWCSCLAPGALLNMPASAQQQQQNAGAALPCPRLVTCGAEASCRVWRYQALERQWVQDHELAGFPPGALVRDVAWAPNAGVPFTYIAAGTECGRVVVWLQDGLEGVWTAVPLPEFRAAVCRVGWSMLGTVLSVNCADGSSTLWKEAPDGRWEQIHDAAR